MTIVVGVSGATHEVLLGRQPIFDISRVVHGYELLFRRAGQEGAGIVDGTAATAQVLLNALVEIGIENLGSGELMFVNCSRETLFSQMIFPPERAVLEVLETIELDTSVVGRMRELRRAGFRIALDDFTWEDSKAQAVAESDYVKLDVRQLNEVEMRRHVSILQHYSTRLIAEKVESEAELKFCQSLGIDLFQGYFLRKPDLLRRKTVTALRMTALQIVALCQSPNVPLQKVAEMISGDLAMAWGLLRLANTLGYCGAAPVESMVQAVGRLGTQTVMRWAILLTLVGHEGCPSGYLQLALQRAHMCEALARELNSEAPDTCFLAGLLSLLDSIVEVPMEDLVPQLPLSPKIRKALVGHKGETGRILEAVLSWEHGEWGEFAGSTIPKGMAMNAWLYSLGMSANTMRSLIEIHEPSVRS